jgi:hypothetical protein
LNVLESILLDPRCDRSSRKPCTTRKILLQLFRMGVLATRILKQIGMRTRAPHFPRIKNTFFGFSVFHILFKINYLPQATWPSFFEAPEVFLLLTSETSSPTAKYAFPFFACFVISISNESNIVLVSISISNN